MKPKHQVLDSLKVDNLKSKGEKLEKEQLKIVREQNAKEDLYSWELSSEQEVKVVQEKESSIVHEEPVTL